MNIIDGKLVSAKTREDIKRQVEALPQDKCGKIGLAVILVGDTPQVRCMCATKSTVAVKSAFSPHS